MKLRFEGTALLRVGKHFGGDAAALLRIGKEFVHDIVGIKRLDAEFVQELGEEGFPAGNPPSQRYLRTFQFASASGASFTSAAPADCSVSSKPSLCISRPRPSTMRVVTKMRRLRFEVCSEWLRKSRPLN